jgi:hypothetical protein
VVFAHGGDRPTRSKKRNPPNHDSLTIDNSFAPPMRVFVASRKDAFDVAVG